MIVLSGSPGISERARNPLLHHKVKDFETQFEVFQKITVASAVLDRPETAFSEIDRVLAAALRYKRPVYLELPRDQTHARQVAPHRPPEGLPPSDPDALREALDEAAALLAKASRPVILADVEIHRFHLQAELLSLAESTGMPIATTILGKSVISEAHPLFAGVYEGAMGRPEVTELVESADCLLMLGCFLTDINLGIFTAKLDPARCIDATSEDLRIRHHHYRDVRLDDFLRGLIDRKLVLSRTEIPRRTNPFAQALAADPQSPVRSVHLFGRLNQMLADHPEMTVIADIGDSLFGAADLEMHRHTEFLSPAYYTSMGFGVPAAVGASMANPSPRILVVVGDGAFQMTGHGALDDRAARPEPDRRGAEQPRLHDRAVPARGAVQRHPQLGLSPHSRGARRRDGPGDPDRRRARSRAAGRTGQHRGLQPAERPPRPLRPQPRPRAAGQPAVEDRGLESKLSPAGRMARPGLGFQAALLPGIRPCPAGCPGWCTVASTGSRAPPGRHCREPVCVHW